VHLESLLMAIRAITELDQFPWSPPLSRPAEPIKESLALPSSCSATTPHHAQALLFGQTQFARVRRPPRFPTTVTKCIHGTSPCFIFYRQYSFVLIIKLSNRAAGETTSVLALSTSTPPTTPVTALHC
jgi:hypothetical protein